MAVAGNDSGGECGVATTKTFAMPDVPDLGYWPQPNCSSAHSSSGTNGSSGSSSANCSGGWPGPGNPTLGPNGAAASAGAAASPPEGAGGGEAPADPENHHHHHRANPPFWYSFSYGSVHFTVLSTEHDIMPGSNQYKVGPHGAATGARCVAAGRGGSGHLLWKGSSNEPFHTKTGNAIILHSQLRQQ